VNPVKKWGERRRLPVDRRAITHGFEFSGMNGTITAGFYDDGRLGEIFLRVDKMGDFTNGMCNMFAIAFSTALQHGAPLEPMIRRMRRTGFGDGDIGRGKSLIDYLMKWLESRAASPQSIAGLTKGDDQTIV
jgi:ribonucleoside-diphosphate reductase alpha chain